MGKSNFEAIYKRFEYLEKNRDEDDEPTNQKSEGALLQFATFNKIKPGNIALSVNGIYCLFYQGQYLFFHDDEKVFYDGRMVSVDECLSQ